MTSDDRKASLEQHLNSHIEAIKKCFDNRLLTQALILIYCGIDIMSWLNLPKGKTDAQRNDFISWTNKYLIPNSGLTCNAIDLYAARCGLVHNLSFESSLSRNGTARKIFYAYGTGHENDLQKTIDYKKYPNTTTIHVDKLFEAFKQGIRKNIDALTNDPDSQAIVCNRAGKYFVDNLPKEVIELFIQRKIPNDLDEP